MGILAVLFVLILGYNYTERVRYEKVRLRRTEGWVSYVRLGSLGIKFLTKGLIIYSIILILLLFVYWNFVYHINLFDIDLYIPHLDNRLLAWYISWYDFVKYHSSTELKAILLVGAAYSPWFLSNFSLRKMDIDDNLEALRRVDNTIQFIIEALNKTAPIKISLKSRKVYVGLTLLGSFEEDDELSSVVIIPLLSGYRDPDNLRLYFDCNYVKVYEAKRIQSGIDAETLTVEDLIWLERFKFVIKLDEVESISFFNLEDSVEFMEQHPESYTILQEEIEEMALKKEKEDITQSSSQN